MWYTLYRDESRREMLGTKNEVDALAIYIRNNTCNMSWYLCWTSILWTTFATQDNTRTFPHHTHPGLITLCAWCHARGRRDVITSRVRREIMRYLCCYLCCYLCRRAPEWPPPQIHHYPCYCRAVVVWWGWVWVVLVLDLWGADLSPEDPAMSSVWERELVLVLWHVSQWNSATHSPLTQDTVAHNTYTQPQNLTLSHFQSSAYILQWKCNSLPNTQIAYNYANSCNLEKRKGFEVKRARRLEISRINIQSTQTQSNSEDQSERY